MLTKTIYFSQDKEVSLSIYVQTPSKELSNVTKRPAILIFPGGGYQFCSDREAEPIALSYLAKGYQAFILRYSLKEKSQYPKPLRDAEKALKMILDHHEEWYVIKDKIAVIGFSAGAHLASMLSTSGKIRPNACLLGYPALMTSDKFPWPYPLPQVDSATPETFIFHTYEDDLIDFENALYYANQCKQNHIPFELHLFKKGVHGLSLATDIVSNNMKRLVEPDFAQWFDLSIAWLNHVFACFHSTN